MTLPKKAVYSEPEQNQGNRHLEITERNHGPEENRKQDRNSNRQTMPERDRKERTAHRAAATLLDSESHGEQPTHSGIDSVVCAKEEHHEQRGRAEAGERRGVIHE